MNVQLNIHVFIYSPLLSLVVYNLIIIHFITLKFNVKNVRTKMKMANQMTKC